MAFEAARSFGPSCASSTATGSARSLRALLDEGAGRSPAEYLDALGSPRPAASELATLFERYDLS